MTYPYKIHPSYNISADAMYRYSRRYGSGIGIDVSYLPYVDRIREIDELKGLESTYNKWSVGIGLKHEAYYGNLAFSASLCYYLLRNTGYTASVNDETNYYERVGVKYYFPSLGNLFVGYNIKAHFTKADCMEVSVGVKL